MAKGTQPPVSTRYPLETLERLELRAHGEGSSRSALIQRYVAEGLEMDDHPGIMFRSGPAGRRPRLVGGPDIWEVVAVHESHRNVARTAAWLEQQLDIIRPTVVVTLGNFATKLLLATTEGDPRSANALENGVERAGRQHENR